MFLPIPKELAALGAKHAPSPATRGTPGTSIAPPKALAAPENVAPHKRNPAKDVRLFPAYAPAPRPNATPRAHADDAAPPVVAARRHEGRGAWWEDPIAIGSLLVVAPPIGLAAVWSSRRYGSDARWALTVMTGLMMCLVSAVFVALIVAR